MTMTNDDGDRGSLIGDGPVSVSLLRALSVVGCLDCRRLRHASQVTEVTTMYDDDDG